MRTSVILLIALAFSTSLLAQTPGETIPDAFEVFTVPYTDTGSTLNFEDDYDALCWNNPSTSPDVVYGFTPEVSGYYRFDLCGSQYDTKLFLLDQYEEVLACNDDGYFFGDPCQYQSKLDGVFVAAMDIVFVVVDGYGGEGGDYVLNITATTPCALDCPAEAVAEGEADAATGVPDAFNCGCDCAGDPVYQPLECDAGGDVTICLRSGWRDVQDKDHDYFWGTAGATGSVHLDLQADFPTNVLIASPPGCPAMDNMVAFRQTTGDCESGQLDFSVEPGASFLVSVEPWDWGPPLGMVPSSYDVVLHFTGLDAPQATDRLSWDSVKALYR